MEWAKSIGGQSDDFENSMFTDSSGNLYTTGCFNNTITVDMDNVSQTYASNGGKDIFISKQDSVGKFIWFKVIGGLNDDEGNSITADGDGNVYVTGYYQSSVDFDPGSNSFIMTVENYRNIFILKLGINGDFVWAKDFNCTYLAYSNDIELDNNNNILLSGCFSQTVDFNPGADTLYLSSNSQFTTDVYLCKLDNDGNFIWAENFGGLNSESNIQMSLDNDNNIYIAGCFYNNTIFIDDSLIYTLTSNGGYDIFICKLNYLGKIEWLKNIGGVDEDKGYSISLDTLNNIYITGSFIGVADFDPNVTTYNLISAGNEDIFIAKYDSLCNLLWAKRIGNYGSDISYSANVDNEGNIYATGIFYDKVDFDPATATFYLEASIGTFDVYIIKLNSLGDFIFAKSISGVSNEFGHDIKVDVYGNIYVLGTFNLTIDVDPGVKIYNLSSKGGKDIFIIKYKQNGILGSLFNDYNNNCQRDSLEIGTQNRFVTVYPGNIITQTNESGVWVIDSLPIGTYTATLDTSGNWLPTCPVTQTVTVTNPNEITYVPDFGLVSTQPCASPDVSINMPFMRPCFSNQKVYVNACNQYIATGALNSAYADVELDSLIIPQSASLAYTSLGNNSYRFQLGNLNPGQCKNFTIDCQVSCDAVLGQTLCVEANLYPADSCVFDTIPSPFPGDFTPCTLPWDKSSLSVKGWCQNDSIYFSVCNSGQDMDCFSPVRIYIDGVYTTLDSLQLAAGACFVYSFAGDGRTWRLEADQHPLHPGNSHPNATVEACGDLNNWTPDLVNILPQDDADPVVDIYCGVVTGSYDPNDKAGYPIGLAYNHYIMPNQQLQYVIRFQNTGTDTAFTVVVRDTLDMDLDIFSVVPGVASHTYNFQMYGPRVLEWTFYNIQLPDSNHNEAESHGFCTFTVNQNHDLPNNTKITNSADIYFDYNAPVITNQTIHTVNDQIQTAVVTKVIPQGNKVSEVLIYPNPAKDEVFVESSKLQAPNSKFKGKNEYIVYSVDGKKVLEGKLESPKTRISTKDLESGIYFIEVSVGNEKMTSKLVITR